MYLMNLSFKI